jgi:hypothetical protein
MGLFFFILRSRIRFIIRGENIASGILKIVFLFFGVLNAAGLAYMINHSSQAENANQVILTILTISYLLPVISKFFPSITYVKKSIENHFPIYAAKSRFMELLALRFITVMHLYLILLSLIIFICCDAFRLSYFCISVASIIFSHINTENSIEAVHKGQKGLTLLFIGIAIIMYAGLLTYYQTIWYPIILLATMIFSFFLGVEIKESETAKMRVSKRLGSGAYNWNALLNNASFRNKVLLNNFTIAMIIKFILCISELILFKEKRFRSSENMVFYIILSPAIPFSYAFNNTWGYLRSISAHLLISPTRPERFFNLFIRIIINFLLIDFLIALLFLMVSNELTLKNILLYFFLAIYCVAIGQIASLTKPREVLGAMSFTNTKPATNVLYNYCMIIPIVLLYFCYQDNFYFTFLVIATSLFSIIFLLILKNKLMVRRIDTVKSMIWQTNRKSV